MTIAPQMLPTGRSRITSCSLFIVLLLVGCVQPQYRYGVHTASATPQSQSGVNPIAVGGEHPFVDRVEKVVQAPGRVVRRCFCKPELTAEERFASRVEAITLAQAYLSANQMQDVFVDVRRYEPGEQWARLKANERISRFWKYTAGTLDVVGYSVFPRRAFHRDHYSPFTNTLSLNSDQPLESLYEAGLAKPYQEQTFLGSYAVLQRLPLVPLAHHGQTTSDVLTYAREMRDPALEHHLYPVAYSRLGRVAVREALVVVPVASDEPFYVAALFQMTGGAVGKAIGESVARREAEKLREPSVPPLVQTVPQ